MIDIHCHILPGLDDGASDMRESIEMAKIAAADGIRKIVATPHIKDIIHSEEAVSGCVGQLNNQLRKEGIPVEIVKGAEVYALLDTAVMAAHTVNNSRYVLIEFPYSHMPVNTREILFRIVINGYQPIIAHPERNPSIIKKPNILFELVESGALVQITAGSLLGTFGPDARECARYLLKKDAVNFMATDAHSADYRRPVLSEGLKVAGKIIGKEKADRLVRSNPEAVLKNE